MATQQNIVLWADGPAMLIVEIDRVKLRRVIQNILINALKYTTSDTQRPAIVSVSWSVEGDFRWTFSIQDSGPAMPDDTLAGSFSEQLRPTVEPTTVTAPGEAEPVSVLPDDVPRIPQGDELAGLTNHSTKNVGVGLQIVKRLCELLDMKSQKALDMLFRLRFPVHHLAK